MIRKIIINIICEVVILCIVAAGHGLCSVPYWVTFLAIFAIMVNSGIE